MLYVLSRKCNSGPDIRRRGDFGECLGECVGEGREEGWGLSPPVDGELGTVMGMLLKVGKKGKFPLIVKESLQYFLLEFSNLYMCPAYCRLPPLQFLVCVWLTFPLVKNAGHLKGGLVGSLEKAFSKFPWQLVNHVTQASCLM